MNCGERCAGIGVKFGSFGNVTNIIVYVVLLFPIDLVVNIIVLFKDLISRYIREGLECVL